MDKAKKGKQMKILIGFTAVFIYSGIGLAVATRHPTGNAIAGMAAIMLWPAVLASDAIHAVRKAVEK